MLLDPYFSATKLAVAPQCIRPGGEFEQAKCWQEPWTWLAWNLTGRHVTDCSNGARRFQPSTRAWDRELTRLFNVPEAVLRDRRYLRCGR